MIRSREGGRGKKKAGWEKSKEKKETRALLHDPAAGANEKGAIRKGKTATSHR